MVELYKNKKLINDLALLREYIGRIELDVKQTLSDIEKQDILLEDIQETYFDKPLQLEIQKELEEQIKKHQEEEQQQKDFKDIIE
jgi:hypothetical protein